MSRIKVKIIAVGILILFGLIGFFVWAIFFKAPQLKPRQISAPAQLPVEPAKPAFEKPVNKPEKVIASKSSPTEKKLNIPTLPIPKSGIEVLFKEKSLPTSTISFFENINKAAKTVSGILSATSTPKATPTEIVLSLTDNEFHSLYPDAFIASLMDAQNLIKEYFDPTYKPLPKIETDPQVRLVEEKIVSAFLSANIITKNEAERFITTIRFTLPQLQLMELKKGTFPSLYKSASFKGPHQPPLKGLFLADLVEKLRSALIYPVQAAFCGGCYWSPECFQPGASSPKPGINILRIACYCTGCLYGQGCLDFCTGRAAIYDPTTGLCGCG